ncbi:hypothetical protein [Ralstonia solanacearum]|uniref:hypothetical protein n=1 Tax=Ralstonia solanacearum TaxID=305 RepID=UPI0018D18624|nr:hypothetical protein [Ralstonia solanacearum]
MIEDKAIAKQIGELMLDFGGRLDSSVALVQEKCTLAEFEEYRDAVGKIMGYMLLDIMNPIYLRHPDLKPDDLE